MSKLKEAVKTHGQWVMVLTALATAVTTAVLDRFFPEEVAIAQKNHEAVASTVEANTKAIEDAIADLDDALMREKERRRMVERRLRGLEESRCGTPGLPPRAPVAEPAPAVEAPVPVEEHEVTVRERRPRVGERLRASVRQIPDFQAVE